LPRCQISRGSAARAARHPPFDARGAVRFDPLPQCRLHLFRRGAAVPYLRSSCGNGCGRAVFSLSEVTKRYQPISAGWTPLPKSRESIDEGNDLDLRGSSGETASARNHYNVVLEPMARGLSNVTFMPS
jgi:hypothetical protein